MNPINDAENYLLRRQFRQAQSAAEVALLATRTPFSTVTTINTTTNNTTNTSNTFGLVSLRPIDNPGFPSSATTHQDDVVRLCCVWMQATGELHQPIESTNNSSTTTPASATDLDFIPTIVHRHFPNDALSLPYPASIVWLTFLGKVGALESAKEAILQYVCSPEGRLYCQAHWRAVAASLAQQPSEERGREAQSRYEHLMEVLLLDVLVPLREDTLALDYIDRDVAMTQGRRNSLWQIVRRRWSDNNAAPALTNVLMAGEAGDASSAAAAAAAAAAGGGPRGVTRSGASQEGTAIGRLSANGTSAKRARKRREVPVEEQGITREDMEIICVGVVGVIACGVGAWIGWRRRSALAARFQSISGFLSR